MYVRVRGLGGRTWLTSSINTHADWHQTLLRVSNRNTNYIKWTGGQKVAQRVEETWFIEIIHALFNITYDREATGTRRLHFMRLTLSYQDSLSSFRATSLPSFVSASMALYNACDCLLSRRRCASAFWCGALCCALHHLPSPSAFPTRLFTHCRLGVVTRACLRHEVSCSWSADKSRGVMATLGRSIRRGCDGHSLNT